MDPREFQKEHKFIYEEFQILMAFANNYFIIEAQNTETVRNYTVSLTDDELLKISHQYFSKTSELFEVLTNFFEEPQNMQISLETKGLEFIKFKKKTVSFQFKLQLPASKQMIFSIDLSPKNPNKDFKQIEVQIVDLANRLIKIETFLKDLKSANDRILILEQKYTEFANHKPLISYNLSNYIEKETTSNGPILTFSNKINHKYYNFKNNDSTIIRSVASRKNHIVAWGSQPIKKKGLQFFYYKVDGLNKGFEYINACIGMMAGNLLGKVVNLADHDGVGCYFYGVNAQCIWINNTKTVVEAKLGKIGDVFKVVINFDEFTIVWQIDNKVIGKGVLNEKQIAQFDLYPAVTLAYPKETLSLI